MGPENPAPIIAQNKIKMNKKLCSDLMVITAENADGFTVDANTLQPITKGYAVAMAETQNSFNAEGLARVIEFVNGSTVANAFGGWLDRETGLFYWDAVTVVEDLETARAIAKRNKQIAFFDLANGVEIRL